jgi:hypothetical protein
MEIDFDRNLQAVHSWEQQNENGGIKIEKDNEICVKQKLKFYRI